MFNVDVSNVDEGRLVIRQVETPNDPVLRGFAVEMSGAEVQFVRDHLNEILLDPNFPEYQAQAPNITRLEFYETNWGASGQLIELVIDVGVQLAIEELARRLIKLFRDRRPIAAKEISEANARYEVAVIYNVQAGELQLLESDANSTGRSQGFHFRAGNGDEYHVEIASDHGFPIVKKSGHRLNL